MTYSNGLAQTAVKYWTNLYKHGSVALLSIIGVSVPSIVLVFVYQNRALELLAISIISCGIHLSAMYAKDVHLNNHDPNNNPESSREEKLIIGTILLLYFTPVMLITVSISQYVHSNYAIPSVALLIALYYPVIDFEFIRRYRKSLGGTPVLLFLWSLHNLGLLNNLSLNETLEKFLQKPPKMMSGSRG